MSALAVALPAVLCCSWAALAAPSELQRIVHESWTFKEGAPELPTSFAQTADGYLWIGSPAGLFRFDGGRFELFRPPLGDQLQSTNVSTLFAAPDGLWVGFVFGGFSSIVNGRVENFEAATGTVTGFARDDLGTVWAGALGAAGTSGLWRFDGSSWQQLGEPWNAPREPVAQIGTDREGVLWVLTGIRGSQTPKNLYYLAPGDRRFRKAGEDLVVLSFAWDSDNHVLTSRESGRSWLGSSSGLEEALPAYPILRAESELLVDRADGIWVVSDGPGLLRHPVGEPLSEVVGRMSPENSEAIPLGVQSHARLVDREGGIWFGAESGPHRLSYSPLVRQELPENPAPWFMLVPDDDGAVWISAADGVGDSALYRVRDRRVDMRKRIPDVSSFAYRAPDRSFWFGGEGGLWRMADGALARIDLPAAVAERAKSLVTMTDDGSGGFWVSFGGLGLYHLKGGAWTKYRGRLDLPPAEARTKCPVSGVLIAYTDRLNRVFLGCTKSQLTVLGADGERTFGPDDGVEVGNVTAIHGRSSEIWIGGELGLQHFDQGRFQTIRAIDDEALRGISGIVETADRDLWLNGLGGIIHIRRAEIQKALVDPSHRVSTARFDRRSGLPGLPAQLRRMPTAVEGTDGRPWFTVTGGVVWLDPTRASNWLPPPPVSIQSVAADDVDYAPDRSLRFPAGTASVQLRYAAISLSNPEAIRFRYRLREADDAWQDAGRSTSVSYRNLPPGSHRFEVAASDIHGAWSDEIAAVEFTILPAFYQTGWFRALCGILLLLLAWASYQLRVRWLHRQFEMTLDARVAERTRIARELHDTLLQSFHGLLLRFQTASNLLPDRPAESKKVLTNAIGEAAAAITEGRDAVQGLRISATETYDLADSLRAFAEDLAIEASNSSSLSIDVQGTPRALHPIVRDEVFRIASEALRNAFRHAGAARIEVELRYDERRLRLRVRDDGKGIDPEVLRAGGQEGHFGMSGMRERAKLAGGKLTVWSGLDAGTEVELTIPAATAYSSQF